MRRLRTGLLVALAVSLALNLAMLASFADTRAPRGPRSDAQSGTPATERGDAPEGRTPIPPPRLVAAQDCAAQQAAGADALAALQRDIERHTPADAKWGRARANPALTAKIAKGLAAARPDAPTDAFEVDCRAELCRLTATSDDLFERLSQTPYLRSIAGRPRWAGRSVTFELRPDDSVDGIGYLRSIAAQVEAKGLLDLCGEPGGTRRLRVPVRLVVTDESESLDRSGLELTVGTVSDDLALTACVERTLRAHLEALALPAHVSAAMYHTYFYVNRI
jgi:hypothetical protein